MTNTRCSSPLILCLVCALYCFVFFTYNAFQLLFWACDLIGWDWWSWSVSLGTFFETHMTTIYYDFIFYTLNIYIIVVVAALCPGHPSKRCVTTSRHCLSPMSWSVNHNRWFWQSDPISSSQGSRNTHDDIALHDICQRFCQSVLKKHFSVIDGHLGGARAVSPKYVFMSFLLSLNWIERIWGNLLTERFIRLEFGRNTIVIYCQNVQKHSTCLSDASLKYVSVARFNLRCDFIWITKKAISLNMREEGYTPKRSSAKKSFCEHVCEQFVETCVTASVAAIQVHHILPIVSCIFQK